MGITSGDYTYEEGLRGFGAEPIDDKPLGRQVLQIYDTQMKRFPAYKATLDAQLNQWSKNNAKVKEVIIDGVGFQARALNMTPNQITDAMTNLANKQRGIVPMDWQVIGRELGLRAQNPSLWETLSFVTKESAKDIVSGAQAVGKDVIGTYKMAKFLLPVAAVAVIAGLFYRAKGGGINLSGLKDSMKKTLKLNPSRINKIKDGEEIEYKGLKIKKSSGSYFLTKKGEKRSRRHQTRKSAMKDIRYFIKNGALPKSSENWS